MANSGCTVEMGMGTSKAVDSGGRGRGNVVEKQRLKVRKLARLLTRKRNTDRYCRNITKVKKKICSGRP